MSRNNNNFLFHALEFDTIISKVSEQALSNPGKEKIENLSPITDPVLLEKELKRVTEMRDILRYDDPFPLDEFADLRPLLKRAEIEGSFLRPEDFLALNRFLSIARKIKAYFLDRAHKYPLLEKKTRELVPLPELEKEINKIIDLSAEVKDNASPALYKLRGEINRTAAQVRKKLESILKKMVKEKYAQEDTLVLRDRRLVIPMKENHRGRLKGVVVDQSASGSTVFVEPLEVLEMNNRIRYLKIQERHEIEKILKKLTHYVRDNHSIIEEDFELLGEIDSITARAKFSLKVDGNPAVIGENGVLELKQARHPLLLMREKKEEVVPLSLRIGGDTKTLIITGPNAGGKTVALKTVGLLSLMHQCGLHVPAEEGTTIPIFPQIFADIGDRQSIEQDLSTFSSHMENIKTILEKADKGSLVLLDEIGSSTDPAEGAALSDIFLRTLTKRKCITIATTHIGTLKIFAHEEPGVENGSMVFDQKTLRPTYRFQMGIPGSSYAFEIAERLGIPKEIVSEARVLVGKERGKLDRLILHLEEELQRSHSLLSEAEIKESRLSGLVKLYQKQIETIEKESRERKQKILDEAEEVLKSANALVERAVREIKESKAAPEIVRKVRKEIKTQKEKIKILSRKEETRELVPLAKGDWVVWKKHEGRGKIISDPDRTGRVLVEQNGIKLRIPIAELRLTDSTEKRKFHSGVTSYKLNREISDEIDIRGMTADEAIETVDKYLGDAAVAGFNQIRIIHGKGTGVLRREIGKYLKNHPLVKTQRFGNWNEGDTGVTIVELK